MIRVANFVGLPFLLMALSFTAGCEPPPPKPQDLGRVVFNPMEVPGANTSYAMPDHLRKILEKPREGRPPEE